MNDSDRHVTRYEVGCKVVSLAVNHTQKRLNSLEIGITFSIIITHEISQAVVVAYI